MAIKIFRPKDRLKLNIGEIEIMVSPLSYGQKVEVQSLGVSQGKNGIKVNDKIDFNKLIYLVTKFTLKGIKGVENLDGSPYELEFETEDKNCLSDSCVEEILNLSISPKMSIALMQLMNGFPENGKIINPEKPGEYLQGVEIILPESKK